MVEPTEYWALTIFQPWATMIMEGWKPLEFRGWPPPAWLIQHPLAIHAAKRPVKSGEIRGLLYKLERGGEEALRTGLLEHDKVREFLWKLIAAPKLLPLGAVLGTAMVGQPLRDDALATHLGVKTLAESGSPINDSDRDEHSNWAWPLSEIDRFRPMIPATGHQGLWVWKKARHTILG